MAVVGLADVRRVLEGRAPLGLARQEKWAGVAVLFREAASVPEVFLSSEAHTSELQSPM